MANTDEFIHQTMLTCIGNKRKLVSSIRNIVREISTQPLSIMDGFAGSCVVSRALYNMAHTLYTNDMEYYSYLMAQCYLQPPTTPERVHHHIQEMNRLAEHGPFREGIITELYAPRDTTSIQPGERCFYTHENALIIDTLRHYISEHVEPELFPYCIVPLLNKASIHTNTAGVFKGFYKNGDVGCFGGKGENALERILKPIRVEVPVWSSYPCEAKCFQRDMNALIKEIPKIDLLYLDPPYNQHPYGSNYFMLNIIATNQRPTEMSAVSGIPVGWNKSEYNKKGGAVDAMKQLLQDGLKVARYILLSYNNEGIITEEEWETLFQPYEVKKYEIRYDAYKGSRNLKNRASKVMERMYLISKKEPALQDNDPTHNTH